MVMRVAVVLCVLVFGAVVPLLEINETHVFNPHWPAHARLHEVWQLATNALLALLCAALAWRGTHLRLASAVALCVTAGFLAAYLLRDGYGGSMLAVDGSEKIVAGINVSAIALGVMAAVSTVLAAVAWRAKPKEPR